MAQPTRSTQDPVEDPTTEAPFRVTLLVLAGLLVGLVLPWISPTLAPFQWIPFLVVYVIGGIPIARATAEELREGRLSIDFLMGAAALGAAVVGEPLEGGILIFLFSLSNALEARALGKTRSAVKSLVALRPEAALRVDNDGNEIGSVPVESLRPSHRIRVLPGERIPADGRVVEGSGSVDQAAITGESLPVSRHPDDDVFAGTILAGGSLVIEVTRSPDDTLLARIIRLVEEAQGRRAPAEDFIDRFAHPYTLAVVGATVLYAVIPPFFMGWEWGDAFYRAMTLLVVASPCALIISTPAAILSGIANGARHGILFKGGAVLDRAGGIDVVAFDKTGTLTEGRLELLAQTGIGDTPDAELLRLAAGLERDSEHHLAKAVQTAASAAGLAPARVRDFRTFPGEGVEGDLEGFGPAWVGNETMARRRGLEGDVSALAAWVAEQTAQGRSIVYLGSSSNLLGAMAFGDRLKSDAASALRGLRKEGVRRIAVLSGDHPEAVRAITRGLDVDEVRAGLLPDEKVAAIEALLAGSKGVAMVGDGVNDAPAMATASLGIAMGAAGTDVAIETADVVLMGTEVGKVNYALHLGRRSRRIVRQNVYFSIGWMLLLVGIAGTVGLPLTLAVVAHEGSTILVALNGLRLLRSGRPLEG